MNSTLKLLIFLALGIFSRPLFGQSPDIVPSSIAIVVSDIEKASAWYEEIFQLEIFDKMDIPEYDSLKIYFLKGASFELELMEKKTPFSIKKWVPDYNLHHQPLQGFAKVAFKVDKLEDIYTRLKGLQDQEVLNITHDDRFNTRYFIIRDPDGNLIQFIE